MIYSRPKGYFDEAVETDYVGPSSSRARKGLISARIAKGKRVVAKNCRTQRQNPRSLWEVHVQGSRNGTLPLPEFEGASNPLNQWAFIADQTDSYAISSHLHHPVKHGDVYVYQ